MKAIWNEVVVAQSGDTVIVEGNHYFPRSALVAGHFQPSATHSVCGWKGEASYYDVVVGERRNPDAAWYYPTPRPEAAHIAGRIAFWRGIKVIED